MNHSRVLVSALTVLAFAAGCADSPPPPPRAPAPPRPVICQDFPAERQDVVSCRYASQAQGNEVWARSAQLAATTAIAMGATHIQWLSVENSVETVRDSVPVTCKGGYGGVTCEGGPYEVPVGLVAVTRFALLSAAEAAARSNDPLIPPERRPLDAHRIAAARPR